MVTPLLSICCQTYNHEKFLRQCIEGFVTQSTSFNYEILIHDDASTDNTALIIAEYEKKYPEIIKPIYQKENQYSKGIAITSKIQIPRAKGKYIAICEGDDFWIDKYKVQKQIDFLESNSSFGFIHSNYSIIDENNKFIPKIKRNWPSGDVMQLILNFKYNIATPSVLFRTDIYRQIESEINLANKKMGDLILWLELSKVTKFKYIDDITCCYRKLNNSASHSEDIRKVFDFHMDTFYIRKAFCDKYGLNFSENKFLSHIYRKMVKESYSMNELIPSREYYYKMIKYNVFNLFRLRPLIFFLGARYQFCNRIIKLIYMRSGNNDNN